MEPNRPELALMRGVPESLDEFVAAFGRGNQQRGMRYVLALRRFLGEPPPEDAPWNYTGTLSPHTRKLYTATLEEFFEWVARDRGRVVTPEEVTSADVERYVQWLGNPSFTLRAEKLKDGTKPGRLDIYEAVERLGSADLQSILAAVPKRVLDLAGDEAPSSWLSKQLGRMVLHDNLVRSPTIDEVRSYIPMAGIKVFRVALLPSGGLANPEDTDLPAEAKVIDLDDLFIYRVPEPKAVGRRTIATKLSALSSFWETLRQGENIPGGEAVLQHNVIAPVLKRVTRGLSQESKKVSREQKADPVLVIRLLRETEYPVTLAQHRNRALLLFLVFTGVRVAEALSLRRARPERPEQYAGWFDGETDPPTVTLLRKGGKRQVLPYPSIALQALNRFQQRLRDAGAPPDAQAVARSSPGYIPPESPRWRYAELVRRPDAPLFPSLFLWGANTEDNYERYRPNAQIPYEKPLTDAAVRIFLKRLGRRAGMQRQELDRIHPHALRHFAAVGMYRGGKPLTEIQEMLGHDSITTTERYIQEITTEIDSSGQNEILSYIQQFDVPPARREVVETVAEPAPTKPKPKKAPPKPAPAPAPEPAPPPDEPQEAPQVAEIVESVVEATELPPEPQPDNPLPVVPEAVEDPAEVVLTKKGAAVEADSKLVAIGGEQAQGYVPRMIDNVSSGSPDYVYEAMSEVGESKALRELAAAVAAVNRTKKKAESKKTPADEKKSLRKDLKDLRKARDEAREKLEATGFDPIEWTRLQVRTYRGKNRPGKVIVEDEGKQKVQQNEWLLKNYDPWPLHYGMGRDSLLPWFAKGQATVEGYVVEGTVVVPPVPVLSPEQVDPQTDFGAKVLDCAERVYSRWMDGDPGSGVGPSPTRAFGLVRWYGFLSFLTGQLQKHMEKTSLRVEWQPWSSTCRLGSDVRSHDDEWICVWLQQNAHTYVTSIRAFETVSRGKGAEEESFWRAFTISTFQGRRVDDDLPDWFADDDPVHAIYKNSPKEWDRFSDWIGSVTGQQLSADRRKARSDQKKFVKKEIKVSRQVLENEVNTYFDAVDILSTPVGSETRVSYGTVMVDADERDQARMIRDTYEGELERKYGIEIRELAQMPREERIRTIVAEAFPEGTGTEGEEESRNTLGDSKLFDARYFRLDRSNHTITHTPAFREEFFDQYGQDSELVLRRAARAMWEYAKENAKMLEGKLTASEYSYLYSMMLSYVSWVIPPGEEMERQIAERLPGVQGRQARLRWISSQGEAMRAIIYAGKAMDVSDLEQQPGESEEAWAQRITPLLKQQLPEDAPQRALINPGNALAIYKYLMMGDAMAAEEEASAAIVQQAVIGEIAGEAGTGRVVAPGAGRQARKEFEERKKEVIGEQTAVPGVVKRRRQTPNYSGLGYLKNGEDVLVQTHAHWVRASRYLRNAQLVLPSPFAMIQAMSQGPDDRRGLFGWIR